MSAPELHPDILGRKTFEEISGSLEKLQQLVGLVMLFNRDSQFYRLSGLCIGVEFFPETGETTLAFTNPCKSDGKFVSIQQFSPEAFRGLMDSCDAFIGQTIEQSFLLT